MEESSEDLKSLIKNNEIKRKTMPEVGDAFELNESTIAQEIEKYKQLLDSKILDKLFEELEESISVEEVKKLTRRKKN